MLSNKGASVKSAYSLPVLLFLSIALPHMMVAQSTGSILGTVTDASGGAIASAAVTVIETGTNTQRVLTTDSAGRYVANVLQLGTYSVKVTAQGFRGAEKTGIVLEAQASPQIDFSLAPATVSSEVTVEA
jgi:Carboxypeptidase regulatory-like domain